jgi:nucleoside-diphosphate-sugar epimerase
MKVLVSGGTGLVGRYVVEELLAAGYQVIVGGRRAPLPRLFSRPVEFAALSLDPDKDQIDAFDDAYFFVHAALSHVPGKYRGGEGDDPKTFHRLNLDGTVRLFEAAKRAGTRRCIFLSSRAGYGHQPPGTILTEEMQCEPETLYGDVKLEAERSLALSNGQDFVTASLRATGIYGPAGPGLTHKWAGLFADYLAGRPVLPRIGTEVHGDDVAGAVGLMLEADAALINGQTFNVSDILTGHHEILAIVKQQTGCPHPLPDTLDQSGYNRMSSKKMQALGWRPGGAELLRRTITQLVKDTA